MKKYSSGVSKSYVDGVAAAYSWTTKVSAANKTARLALPQTTDFLICIESDTQTKWYLNPSTDPSVEANWTYAGSVADTIAKEADGTTNHLSKWASANTLKDSGVVENASGNVGIGTTSPLRKLQVDGGNYSSEILLSGNSGSSTISAYINVASIVGNNGNTGVFTIRGLDSNGTAGTNLSAVNINAEATYITGNISVNGYTKLGLDAPKIKTKKITGIMPPTSQTDTYQLGVLTSKILSFDILVKNTIGNQILPNHGAPDVNFNHYYAYLDNNTGLVIELATSSTAVAGQSFKVLVTYEE